MSTKGQPAGIPRIEIGKTVTNDLRLMLDLLVPTQNLARLIRDYETVLAEHQAEMILISQFITRNNGHHQEPADLPVEPMKKAAAKEASAHKHLSWLADGGSILR